MGVEEITALQRRLTDAGCYTGPIDGKASATIAQAQKACPVMDPMLVIETGMHTAPIYRIGVDRECRLLVTGSEDKTVRLWSLPEGHLLRTLQPTVPIFAAVLRVPFAAIAPMIIGSCAVGAYAVQNAMFDIWLMLGFGAFGYVLKKLSYPFAPLTLALVLGSRTEDAFRLSMIGSSGDLRVFWSNWLVGSITTLALVLLFWPLISTTIDKLRAILRAAFIGS